MEKRDLYDENRVFMGKTIYKGEQVPDGCYCLMVMIFMENNDGRFLIQKRSKDKGGKWAMTGGHPKSGEDSMTGLLVEVEEELGLYLINEDVKLIKTKVGHGNICDVYYVKMNIDMDKVVCQKEEVDDIKLSSIDEIKQMINDGDFHKGHGQVFLSILDDIKQL